MDVGAGSMVDSPGLEGLFPTCLTAAPDGSAWCGTRSSGVFVSEDGGASWRRSGLEGERVMSVTASPSEAGRVWAGAEPSAVWSTRDRVDWEPAAALDSLPSSSEWAFPPKPETHHVRWIACHPSDPGRLWVAIEAGALITTRDGGRTWEDRAPDGPYDTHELGVHPDAPDVLRVSAGDGYYESHDGGRTWSSPGEGLDVGYLRSVAIDPGDPETVIVSASSRARSAYAANRSDGRLFRRRGAGPWTRPETGWPEPPRTIAPLLAAARGQGDIFAADERGLHRSGDGGVTWASVAAYPDPPTYLRGVAPLARLAAPGEPG